MRPFIKQLILRTILVPQQPAERYSNYRMAKGYRQLRVVAKRTLKDVILMVEVARDELYARIDARVDRMRAEGLLDEARALLPHRGLNALSTVGYKELFLHFDGKLALPEAVALIKQHSRNYAKRQMTWLRRETAWHRAWPDHVEEMASFVNSDASA